MIDSLNSDILYIGNDLGVYCSTNGGDSWEAFSNGLPDAVLVMHLSISPANRKLRVATHGHGVYQGDLIESDFTATNDLEKMGLKNLTIFPNPAVYNKLKVDFSSTQSGWITISIYDLNSQLLSQQKTFREMGPQIISVDISNLSAGTYFIKLENGKQKGVEKFIVAW